MPQMYHNTSLYFSEQFISGSSKAGNLEKLHKYFCTITSSESIGKQELIILYIINILFLSYLTIKKIKKCLIIVLDMLIDFETRYSTCNRSDYLYLDTYICMF